MRIAVFVKNTTLHASFGGLETQNQVLCEGLVSHGNEVVIFSPKRDIEEDSKFQNGVEYVFVPCKYKLGFILGFGATLDKNNWINKSVEFLKTAHSKNKFDLVLGQSSAAVGIIKQKHLFKIPVVSIAHGSILSEYKTYLSEIRNIRDLIKLIPNTGFVLKNFFFRQRDMIHGSNKVVAVSNYVKNTLIEETYSTNEHIRVIHNGINPVNIVLADLNRSHTKTKVKLIYVGRMERSKGVHLLLEQLANNFPNVELLLIGDGPYKTELQSIAEELSITEQVTFYGKVPHSQAIELMSSADIFVLPTLRIEGFPMTIVEAMFVGLPILASNMGGIVDAVDDGKTGYLITSNNAEELKDRLDKLVGSRDLRTLFGSNSKAKAHKEYTVNVMIDKYMDVFKEVIK